MPNYTYSCKTHGEFDVWQSMKEEHFANCEKCGNLGRRIFHPSALMGDLPYKKSKWSLGHTREELYQNLGKEGLEAPETWKYDKHQREEEVIRKQKAKK